MAAVNVSRVTNANIYVDGVGLLGMAEEVEVPMMKHKMTDHKGLGMAGTGEFWAGIDKLEAKIKWASIYEASELIAATPFTVHLFQIHSETMTYTSAGLAEEAPVLFLMSGAFKDGGKMNWKHQENVDRDSSISVYHAEFYVAGIQTFLYDMLANIYIVDGVDQLANFRNNLAA